MPQLWSFTPSNHYSHFQYVQDIQGLTAYDRVGSFFTVHQEKQQLAPGMRAIGHLLRFAIRQGTATMQQVRTLLQKKTAPEGAVSVAAAVSCFD